MRKPSTPSMFDMSLRGKRPHPPPTPHICRDGSISEMPADSPRSDECSQGAIWNQLKEAPAKSSSTALKKMRRRMREGKSPLIRKPRVRQRKRDGRTPGLQPSKVSKELTSRKTRRYSSRHTNQTVLCHPTY